MPSNFDSFAGSPLGCRILAVVDRPNRLVELEAFSREGFPAVTALVSELTPVLEPLKGSDPKLYDRAKQFAGHVVGQRMRAAGHAIRKPRMRVPGRLFTVAATWGPAEAAR